MQPQRDLSPPGIKLGIFGLFSLALLGLITVEETKREKHTRLMEVQEFINLFNRRDLSLM